KNGLYLSPAELADLERKAQPVRTAMKLAPRDPPAPLRPEMRGKLGESFDAQQKLFNNMSLRSMTNYDAHLHVAEAEKDPQTVLARKLIHYGLRYNKKDQHEALP